MLNYKAIGYGPKKVVVLHDWLGDHRNYLGIERYLSQDHFTWIFADLRGYGLSRGIAGQYTLSEAVADVWALIEKLNLDNVALVSHSMTGMVALRMALEFGDRVAKVVAAAPVTDAGLELDHASLTFFTKAVTDQTTCGEVIANVTGGRYGEEWRALKTRLAFEASTEEARMGYLRNMLLKERFTEDIRGLSTPVLAICGRHDAPAFVEEAIRAKTHEVLPNISYETIEESGHYMMEEAPVRFASLIQAFIS
ncbi:alpha/beta fold hydrolase [Paraburkholderia sediminicola]|uniref:alpha/beta fold hydrolase n=1 Tax=Paraburkholderia sediminicola TaxID=458836 RepID=UPI0038BB39E3